MSAQRGFGLAAYPEGSGYLSFAHGKLSREGIHVLKPIIAGTAQLGEPDSSSVSSHCEFRTAGRSNPFLYFNIKNLPTGQIFYARPCLLS